MERDVLGGNILQHEDVQRPVHCLFITRTRQLILEKKECDDIFGVEIL